MSGQHTQFQIDGTQYLVESNCNQAIFPCLSDKVIRHLERIGKHAAKDMYGHTAKAEGRTRINGELISFNLTINPKGLSCS